MLSSKRLAKELSEKDVKDITVEDLKNDYNTALELVRTYRMLFEDPKILALNHPISGWTIAHEQVSEGWVTDNKEVLLLSDKEGLTSYVLTLMILTSVRRNVFVTDPNLLLVKDTIINKEGKIQELYIAELQQMLGWEWDPKTKEEKAVALTLNLAKGKSNDQT